MEEAQAGNGGMITDEAVNKPSVYMEDDGEGGMRAVYRASAIYSCQNALLAQRMGVGGHEPPPWLQQRFDAGHDHEPLILRRLQRDFMMSPYGQQDTVTWKIGPALVRGHVDAFNLGDFRVTHINGVVVGTDQLGTYLSEEIGWSDGALVVVDAKALSDGSYKSWVSRAWTAFPHYAWQQFVYVEGSEAAGIVMAVKNKNTDDMRVEYWDRDHLGVTKADIVKKVMSIERMSKDPAALFRDPCSPKMFPCPVFDLHPPSDEVKVTDGEIEGGFDAIAELAVQREAADRTEKAAAAEKERLDVLIRALFGNAAAKATLPASSDLAPKWKVSTYNSTYTGTNWEAIAKDLGCTVEGAKATYTTSMKSSKLTVKVTPPKS